MSMGEEIIDIGVPATGSWLTSSIGSATVDESILTGEGWGRGSWGEFAWGVNFSVAPTGQNLTSQYWKETAFTDVNVSVTGSQISNNFWNFFITN